jgi:small-conductance mechanosensitive channel
VSGYERFMPPSVLADAFVATAPGRLVLSAAAIVVSAIVASVAGRVLARRREDDPYARYYARKISRYVAAVVAVIALAIIWRAFAGRISVVLGLMAAGIAFAMQETIGAIAGWFNILSGRIFRVGDRIEMGGVRGDVIDVTPLRTKIMEMGSPQTAKDESSSWVRGRQYTGRIVAVSNKMTFTEPVYNYSAVLEFLWEELTIPVPYASDWRMAETILREEAQRASNTEGAREAIRTMVRRYPVGRAEVEPRVFVSATDNYVELSARFVVPLRAARSTKDEMTRRVLDRFKEVGIEVASATEDVTVRFPDAVSDVSR